MRKIFYVMIVIAMAAPSWAVDPTVTFDKIGDVAIVTIAHTGDSSTGAVPSVSTDAYTHKGLAITEHIKGLALDQVEVNPGTPAPDAADVTVTQNGIDLLDGAGTELIHPTDSLAALPATMGVPKLQPIKGPLTYTVTGQSTINAQFVIESTFVRIK